MDNTVLLWFVIFNFTLKLNLKLFCLFWSCGPRCLRRTYNLVAEYLPVSLSSSQNSHGSGEKRERRKELKIPYFQGEVALLLLVGQTY